MTIKTLELDPKSYARIAGSLYLVIAVFGAFAIGYVPSVIIVSGDAAATASNLMANIGLFRLGILGDTVVLLAEVVLTVMLYIIFKPVSRTLSLVAAWSRLAMVVIMAVNILINAMPLFLLGGAEYIGGIKTADLQTASLVLFEAHQMGIYVWQLFFGLHLVALAFMIIKSELFPRVLGWMMLVGSFGYSGQGLAKLMRIESDTLTIAIIGLLIVVTIGELAFAFWLLVKGTKTST